MVTLTVVIDILLAVVGLSILVIIHEGGHYFAARAFGMRVVRFSVGFGPTLFRYQPKGSPTTFQVGAIPFLAYVQIAGMNPYEEVEPDDPGLYFNKGVFARIVTIIAGPVANYLTASLFVFGLLVAGYWPEGQPRTPMAIQAVSEDTPAAEAKLRPGDVVRKANGKSIDNVIDLQQALADRAGKPTTFVIERDGLALDPIVITPKDMEGRGIIGVTAVPGKVAYVSKGLGEATVAAFVFPFRLTMVQLAGIADLIKRKTIDGLTGPVGMGKIVAEQARKGVPDYLYILMLLSVALGMFNLLPFPALDGGRLVFLGFELVTRRRPNERFEATIHMVGILFLLALLVVVTFRDVNRPSPLSEETSASENE